MFTGFSFRLIDIQVTQHEEYADRAAVNHGYKQLIYARRGSILDANGLPLAQNEPVKNVIADGTLIKDYGVVAQSLSPLVEIPVGELEKKLRRTRVSKPGNTETPSP